MLAYIKKRRLVGERGRERDDVFLHVDAASDDLLDGSTAVGNIGSAVPEQCQELDDAEDQAQKPRVADLFCRYEDMNERRSKGVRLLGKMWTISVECEVLG